MPFHKIVRLRERNQITLPSEVVERFGMAEGGFLQLVEDEQGFRLLPTQIVALNTPAAQAAEREALAEADAGQTTRYASGRQYADALKAKKKRARKAALINSAAAR
jgi:bifunctional DNA-binding transcriptional regulator/antitoxin component of YhaV-PrlF toxin-antitoxin module